MKDGSYRIDIDKEMQNEDFWKIMDTSGLRKVVSQYINDLDRILSELTNTSMSSN